MSGAYVVAREVVAFRGTRQVLARATIEVAAGEVVALIGPNGAGKSTLLGALAGDVAIAGGEASIGGLDAASRDLLALAKLRAVVRQDTRVVADLTAHEVVALGRAPHGDGTSAEGVAVVRAALETMGLAPVADRLVPRLSGGEQQRVHLARALAQVAGPALVGQTPLRGAMLLDEPASALDLAHAVGVLDLLRRLARAGLAVLVVLHDLDHAARVADRVAVLAGGQVVAAGTPHEVLRPEVLAGVFGVRTHVVDAPWAGGRPWVGVVGLATVEVVAGGGTVERPPEPPGGAAATETPRRGTDSGAGC